MAKKIKTLEDLAEISGTAAAELGLKKGIETSQKPAKPKPSKPSQPTKAPKKPRKPRKTVVDEVHEVTSRMPTTEELFPVDFDALRKEPYVLGAVQKKKSRKALEEIVSNAEERSKHFMDIYDGRIAIGDNSRGFKIVAINTLREAEAIQEYLKELEQVENA